MHQQLLGNRRGDRKGTPRDDEGLWDWNLKSNRVHFSPGWISLVGCQDHEFGNTPEDWFQRVHPEDSDRLLREIEVVRTEGTGEFDLRYRLRHKNGTYRWMSSRGVVVRNEDGEAIRLTGSQSDVTVETVTDPQTGLPNRLLLMDRLTQSIDRANRYNAFHFAVLLIDIGRPPGFPLKSGAAVGDPLVTAAARRLETCLRIAETSPSLRHNDLVARWAGDQFAILLDGLKDVGHAKVVADRILAETLNPFALSGREVRLSASIGVAVSVTGYLRAEDALRDAETALYRAQVLGGSHCEIFDTAILKSEQAELQLEGDFDAALQRREFELFYQPIVSLASNQVIGFEALVRWQHPVLGMIGPLDFIPIAERTGFIMPLGNWILREACLQLRTWQADLPRSKDLWISVNLSGVQLKDPALVEQIGEALRDSDLEPRSLTLELTEGVAMDNPAAVTTLLMRLRATGIRISIDDFGTGYSSLAYVRQFPLDTLKVDQSFVRGMETDRDTAEIVAGMTAMAQQLGLHVVAEGIENEAQLALLRSLRCESAQGFLFAKPLNADTAAELLKTGLPPRPQRPRHEVAAFPSRREASMSKLLAGGRRLLPSRALLISASVLALLSLSGVVVLFTRASPESGSTAAPSPPSVSAGSSPTTDTSAGSPVSAPVASTVKPEQEPASTAPAQRPAAPTSANASTSFDVLHLHRIGSCRGRLVVSRDGVAFVPNENRDDAFTLKYADFGQTLSESTLTIRTSERSYRFRPSASKGKDDDGRQLRAIVQRISRLRD